MILSLNCGYPGCKKKFPIDYPTVKILSHMERVHKVNVFDPRSLFEFVMLKKVEGLVTSSQLKGET